MRLRPLPKAKSCAPDGAVSARHPRHPLLSPTSCKHQALALRGTSTHRLHRDETRWWVSSAAGSQEDRGPDDGTRLQSPGWGPETREPLQIHD